MILNGRAAHNRGDIVLRRCPPTLQTFRTIGRFVIGDDSLRPHRIRELQLA